MSDLDDIGTLIRRLRKDKGWSQQKLADLARLDRTTVGALERDDYSDIGIRKVQRILGLLGKKLSVSDAGLPILDQLLLMKSSS